MTRAVPVRRGPPPSLSGARVLVVEGYEDALELYDRVLSSGGAEVRAASTSRDGLARCDSWRPGVLVTGVGLADGDAFALADALRERDPDVRLVAVTTNVRVAARDRVLAHGFHACLPVPVSPTDLCWAVADALRAD